MWGTIQYTNKQRTENISTPKLVVTVHYIYIPKSIVQFVNTLLIHATSHKMKNVKFLDT